MSRKKKQHICVECGEAFNHGIGLRKHQRQSGHKGSRISEEGDEGGGEEAGAEAEPEPEAAPPPPPKAAPAPVVQPEPEPDPEPEPEPEPVTHPAAVVIDNDDDDRTVPVSRTPIASRQPLEPQQAPHSYAPEPSSRQHTRQKIDLVRQGMKVVISAKAKDAGQQLRQSARSGADIFTEALKLAFALTCFLAIPTFLFFWWKSSQAHHRTTSEPAIIDIQDGALAARSTVLKYLDHLGKGQLDSAYQYLSPTWRTELSPEDFQEAFLDIEDVRWAVNDQRLNADGDADVLVRLAFKEGGKSRRYLGLFRLQKSTQGWRIDRTELSPDSST